MTTLAIGIGRGLVAEHDDNVCLGLGSERQSAIGTFRNILISLRSLSTCGVNFRVRFTGQLATLGAAMSFAALARRQSSPSTESRASL